MQGLNGKFCIISQFCVLCVHISLRKRLFTIFSCSVYSIASATVQTPGPCDHMPMLSDRLQVMYI